MDKLQFNELKEYLDFKSEQYNNPDFIETDPIQIPHQFHKKEDIEIIGFLVASIAWGNRTMIINNGNKLVQLMGNSPHDFVMNYNGTLPHFVHRTFNSVDLDFFIRGLRAIYENGTFESAFNIRAEQQNSMSIRISNFRSKMLEVSHEERSQKHISNPLKNSAAKRINMFLRWMVRNDKNGVDFGLWNTIPSSELMLPLDVHTGNISRSLGLLERKQNDWKALELLITELRKFDPEDPVKYDFALFGIGAFEKP